MALLVSVESCSIDNSIICTIELDYHTLVPNNSIPKGYVILEINSLGVQSLMMIPSKLGAPML